jgi:secondary thiamine-phosphate synthase enzyme
MAAETGKDSAEKRGKTRTHSLEVETRSRVEFKDITGVIQRLITESTAQQGTCIVFVPHTTAAVLVNENADPALLKDLDTFLKQLAPRDRAYQHNDGNCDAHLKASIIGTSKSLFFENGRLALGRWQGIFFCEFDGPRRRELRVKIISD